jgi:hypothetical protein
MKILHRCAVEVGHIAFALALIALMFLALPGCTTTPTISPDQLATVTRENHASVGCATGTGPWGRAGVVFVNAEHASVASGKLSVNTDCTVTIEANQPPPVK